MYKVLIAEDEMLVRHGLKFSIEWEKYNMNVIGDAPNGREALELYEKYKPDLVITDIKMPIMDGMKLISEIRKKDNKTRIVILSCLEEFDLVREAMSMGVSDYILKLTMTEEEIDTVLTKILKELNEQKKHSEKENLDIVHTEAIKDKLFRDYVFYNLYSEQEFQKRVQSLGLKIGTGDMILAVMEIDHYENLKALIEDQKGYLTKFALMNVISEIMDKHSKGEVFHDDGARYILVFNDLDVITTLKEIKNAFSVYFNTSVSFGLSSANSGLNSLKTMYNEAIQALDAKFYLGTGIFTKDDQRDLQSLAREQLKSLHECYSLFGILDENFENEYKDKVNTLIQNLPKDKERLKDSLYQFLHWISRRMNVSLSDPDFYGVVFSFGESLKYAETLSEAIEGIKNFIIALRNLWKSKNKMSDEIVYALEYMNNNYMNDISLQDVAAHVNLSPSYFSSLFKKELGMNFIESLNEIRIEKAKILLRDTNLKIYELAEKVGFKESTYFSTLFKKTTGLTPYKFRQIWKNTTEDINEC